MHGSGLIALLRGWSTVLGGTVSSVINQLQSIVYSVDSEPQDFLLMYYPLIDYKYFDEFKRDKLTGFSQSYFSYNWVSTTFDNNPIGGRSEKVWNITEFSIPSISARFNSNFDTGFTVRIWFKITKEDLTSK